MSGKSKSKKSVKTVENEHCDSVSDNGKDDVPSEPQADSSVTTQECPSMISSSEFTKYLSEALKSDSVRQGFSELFKHMIKEEVNAITRPLSDTLGDVSDKLETVSHKVDSVEIEQAIKHEEFSDKLKLLDSEQKIIKSSILSVERRQKAANIKVVGIPSPKITSAQKDTAHERKRDFVEKFIKVLGEVGIDSVTPSDCVDVTFGVTPGNQAGNFAIVTLINERKKNHIYLQRTKLKNLNSKIYLNEDLTKIDAQLFKRAREEVKAKILFSSWTRNGQVYGKATEKGKPFLIE